MKRWFADSLFRAVMRNAAYLGSSKLLGALLGLLALTLAGRALDTLVFGMLALVQSYAAGAAAITKFQTWQLVLRYGGPALAGDDPRPAHDAIALGFGLDLTSGLIGMVIAMILLPLVAGRFGLASGDLGLALFYCTLIPTAAAATPTGILRLLDRFDRLAIQQLVTPLLRALAAIIAYFGHLGLAGFAIGWYLADLIGGLMLWAFAAHELRRRDMLYMLRPGLFATARRLPRAWRFVWTTNIAVSVNSAWGPVSTLIIGAIIGPAAAGLYRIAFTLLESAGKPADLLTKGFFPEIMRLDPASQRPWVLALRTGAFAGLTGLAMVVVILVGGKPLINLAFGAKYLAAYNLMTVMMLALAISTAASPLDSLLYMVGREGVALVAEVSGVLAYLLILAILCATMGLRGAGIAYLIGTVLLALFRLMPVLSCYHHRARYARPAFAKALDPEALA